MDFLSYLMPPDRDRLLSVATRSRFGPNEVILNEGDTRSAIFVIRSGEARVERRHMKVDVEVARLSTGEIFGEMGFIEGFRASATVVADERCEVAFIEAAQIQCLIEQDPGFYGRFYQSLAQVLSRRLRTATDIGLAEFAWGSQRFGGPSEGGASSDTGDWMVESPLRNESC